MEYYCDKMRHLICLPYSVDNLHKMADNLDIKKCWYHGGQHPHYDIPKRRIEEVQAKCTLVTAKEILLMIDEGKEMYNST